MSRTRYKRACRELDELRALDTAWDLISYVVALGLVLALVVTLC